MIVRRPNVTDEAAIRDVLRGVTAAWRENRLDDLEPLLRGDVVYVAPGGAGRIEGRDACIDSYRQFLSLATIHDYTQGSPAVDVFGDAAVATYRFEIEYELNGERHREPGHDLFVLVRDPDGWRVAWRTLIALPATP